MRHLDRVPEPDVLVRSKVRWTEIFVKKVNQKPNERPSNKQYAHTEIRQELDGMSFHKCFYCERKLKGASKEVDHYIEVAERPDLAFEWTNLYLACDKCNDKCSNKKIPVTDTLDPCKHSDEEIREHLTFEDEIIRINNNSSLGEKTIKKYRLDSDPLDHLRCKALKDFHKTFLAIERNRNEDGGREMNEDEKKILRMFKQKDHPFSMMFTILLEKHGL